MADATEPTGKRGFLEELKRRHVWRVAIAYAVAAWLLVQVATQVFPFFDIPNWAVRLVVILLAIGFVVAVVFAWVFELTPEGIRRTAASDSPEARSERAHRDIGRKLNALIIAVLVIAVALMGWRMLAMRRAADRSPDAAKRNPGNRSALPIRQEKGNKKATPSVALIPAIRWDQPASSRRT